MSTSPEIEVKTCAIFDGLEAACQADKVKMLTEACSALALLTSQRKEERERGKQMVRNWRHGL